MLWPPFRSTLQSYVSLMIFAAFSMSFSFLISISASISASGIFGVITFAIGSNFFFNVSIASSLINLTPLVETITGSTTILSALNLRSFVEIISMILLSDTIPILTASGLISVNTASNCFPTNSSLTSSIPNTPVVFCAVKAVMTLMA